MMHHSMAPADGLVNVEVNNISGRPHPKADSVIDRAHRGSKDREYFIVGSSMSVIDFPRAENNMTTIVHAQVRMFDSVSGTVHIYEDIGDANKENCNGPIGAHAPRMASTRALSRALGQALNIAGAVAKEIMEGGTGQQAVQQQYNQQTGGYQQAPAQGGGGAPVQGGSSVRGQFPNAASWKWTVPGGDHRNKQIDDPSVPTETLQYWLGRGFFSKNQQTGAFDVPDPERTAMFQAEIARRQNGDGAMQTPPQQQQPAPQYQQPQQGAPQGGYQPPQYQQPAQQQQAAPQYQPPQQQMQQGTPQGGGNGWVPTPQQINDLMQLGKNSNRNWPMVKQLSMDTFGKAEPRELSYDEFNMLRMQLGGQPI